MTDDSELLREYVERGSDEAFRTLVERHSGMVHGAALRVVGNGHLAEEVAQATFIILARKAAAIRPGTILPGWLYRTAHFVALEALRAERRRQQHYKHFVEMNDPRETASVWSQIAPLLEQAMGRLGAADRDAVVLRFLEERSFAEVAAALGITEAAAKMRVGRALERLRAIFVRRGVTVPESALFAALSTHGVSAAPSGLSASITTAALANGTATNSAVPPLVKGAWKVMMWNKIKFSMAIGLILLVLAGGGMTLRQQAFSPTNPRGNYLANLEPLAGEWEGAYELRGDGLPNPLRQSVALTVSTAQQGRACEIEMRVSDAAGQPMALYRFTHTLNRAGDRISTVDDPQIGRLTGDGVITESVDNLNAGEWRAAFRAPNQSQDGFTECRWIRKGDQLFITRHDRFATQHLYSDLQLRRSAMAGATR